ncbi:hypothetical protein [Pseudonocardia eucalypti]|uniref:hypothetical protein n=1 Tax=Pseudonocardia eucalypti TaxID=648755 RepID=UPI0031EA7212
MGERVVGVAVLGLLHEVVLPLRDLRQLRLPAFPLVVPRFGLLVVDAGEVGGEEFLAVWAEDAIGVEPGDRVHQGVFA